MPIVGPPDRLSLLSSVLTEHISGNPPVDQLGLVAT
jgi:hypothetical protein